MYTDFREKRIKIYKEIKKIMAGAEHPGRVPFHKNRTHNSLPFWGGSAGDSGCTHKKTGRHPQA